MSKEKRNESKIVFSWGPSETLGKALSKKLSVAYHPLPLTSFPDGELLVRSPTPVAGKDAIIVQTIFPPNERLMEVMFAAATMKDLGAKNVVLVAPYLAYMRQDKRFREGEAITSKIVGKLLSPSIDMLITVDPHLHRHKSLTEVYDCACVKTSAADAIAAFIQKRVKMPIIVGPDEESLQWAKRVSGDLKVEMHVLHKTRHDSEHVDIDFDSKRSLKGRSVVIVDDIISTGHTMMEVIKDVKKLGAKKIYCIGVHGIFAKHAYEKMKKLGAIVVTCNTIPHKSNAIDVSDVLVEALKTRVGERTE